MYINNISQTRKRAKRDGLFWQFYHCIEKMINKNSNIDKASSTNLQNKCAKIARPYWHIYLFCDILVT